MDVNTLENLDDEGFVGNIASFDYDFDFTLAPTAEKRTDKSPDFDVLVKSPRGRWVSIGAAWRKTANGSGNEYISITVDLRNIGRVNVNAVQGENDGDPMKIIPFASTGADLT